jgi:ATP phosphoribosyltransferase
MKMIWNIIEGLKENGAQGILVAPIENGFADR